MGRFENAAETTLKFSRLFTVHALHVGVFLRKRLWYPKKKTQVQLQEQDRVECVYICCGGGGGGLLYSLSPGQKAPKFKGLRMDQSNPRSMLPFPTPIPVWILKSSLIKRKRSRCPTGRETEGRSSGLSKPRLLQPWQHTAASFLVQADKTCLQSW